jgi:AcrR family transcriptional regulator
VPRAGLSRSIVISEAAELVDEVGWGQLTMASVADRLGVRLPSLYKHIGSLDDLRRGIGLLALGELRDVLASAAIGRSGPDALREVALAYGAYARAHPGRYASTIAAPGPGEEERTELGGRVLEVVFAVLAGYGLAGDDAVHATRVMRAALHGFVTLEASGGFGMPQDIAVSYEYLIRTLDESLARWKPVEAAHVPPPRRRGPRATPA